MENTLKVLENILLFYVWQIFDKNSDKNSGKNSDRKFTANIYYKLEKFILDNNIDLILYNGGTLEKDLCTQLDIPSIDLVCKNPEMCQKRCLLIYIKMQNFHVQQLRKLNIKWIHFVVVIHFFSPFKGILGCASENVYASLFFVNFSFCCHFFNILLIFNFLRMTPEATFSSAR